VVERTKDIEMLRMLGVLVLIGLAVVLLVVFGLLDAIF
jgi:hypothetical protein